MSGDALPLPAVGSHRPQRRRRRRAAVALGLVAGGAGLITGGVSATWQSGASLDSGSMGAARMHLALSQAGTTTFSAGVDNLLPGDWLYRYVDLTNDGSTEQELTATVSGTGALVNGAHGLTVLVETCSVAWSGGSCAGTRTARLAETSLAAQTTVDHGHLAPGATQHVRYRFALPTTAESLYQGTSGTVSVGFVGSSSAVGGRDRSDG